MAERNSPRSAPKPRDRQSEPSMTRGGSGVDTDGWHRFPNVESSHPAGAPPLDWWNIPLLEGEEETRYGPKAKEYRQEVGRLEGDKRGAKTDGGWSTLGNWNPETSLGAPPLDWWNIPPGGYEGAHYAVWPPELLIKPIKAMCPSKVCRVCGEPSRRIVETERLINGQPTTEEQRRPSAKVEALAVSGGGIDTPLGYGRTFGTNVTTVGFTDCGHDDYRNGMVLDPFAGSGTTLMVATGHGRDAIGIDLDSRSFDLALERVGPFILERAL